MKQVSKQEIFDIIKNENIDTATEIIWVKIKRPQNPSKIAQENGKRMGDFIQQESDRIWKERGFKK